MAMLISNNQDGGIERYDEFTVGKIQFNISLSSDVTRNDNVGGDPGNVNSYDYERQNDKNNNGKFTTLYMQYYRSTHIYYMVLYTIFWIFLFK